MINLKRMLFAALVLIGGTVIACMAAEIVVRATQRNAMVLFPRFHSAASYGPYTIRSMRPNTTFTHTSMDGVWQFAINEKGLRSPPGRDYSKQDGVVRVVCVGDSHTAGFEVGQRKTYASVIERHLSAKGISAEVINAGISGFGTAEALVYIENEAVNYQPDAIVLGFFANDYDDNLKSDLFRVVGTELVTNKTVHIPGVRILESINQFGLIRWLSQRSYAYSFVFNAVWDMKKRALLTDAERTTQTERAIPEADADKLLEGHKGALAKALLARIDDFCASNKIQFIVLDIPQLDLETQQLARSLKQDSLPNNFKGRYIDSVAALSDLRGVADIFVPNGQRHINETTHLLLGVETSKAILESIHQRAAIR